MIISFCISIILGLLTILLHEYGHYLALRYYGVKSNLKIKKVKYGVMPCIQVDNKNLKNMFLEKGEHAWKCQLIIVFSGIGQTLVYAFLFLYLSFIVEVVFLSEILFTLGCINTCLLITNSISMNTDGYKIYEAIKYNKNFSKYASTKL